MNGSKLAIRCILFRSHVGYVDNSAPIALPRERVGCKSVPLILQYVLRPSCVFVLHMFPSREDYTLLPPLIVCCAIIILRVVLLPFLSHKTTRAPFVLVCGRLVRCSVSSPSRHKQGYVRFWCTHFATILRFHSGSLRVENNGEARSPPFIVLAAIA